MALDFPVGTDFPANGNQIPDGEIYEGFYWDEATGVWKRLCERDKIGDCLDNDAGETVCDRLEILDNQIIELEEEINAIATSVDRGTWDWAFTVNTYLDPLPAGKFYMVDGNNGLVVATEYVNATKVIFSKTDAEGDGHTFDDTMLDKVLMLFDRPDDDFLESVVTAVDEPAGADYAIIDINHIQSLGGPTNAADSDGRYKARLNIFEQPTGGNAGEYVLKAGDDMAGRLKFERNLNVIDYAVPANRSDACIKFENTKDDGNVNATTLYQPGGQNALVCNTQIRATSFYTSGQYLGYVKRTNADNTVSHDIVNPRIALYFDLFNSTDRDQDYGALMWTTFYCMTWNRQRFEYNLPIELASGALPTEDGHAVNKKYVDDKFDFDKYQELS